MSESKGGHELCGLMDQHVKEPVSGEISSIQKTADLCSARAVKMLDLIFPYSYVYIGPMVITRYLLNPSLSRHRQRFPVPCVYRRDAQQPRIITGMDPAGDQSGQA